LRASRADATIVEEDGTHRLTLAISSPLSGGSSRHNQQMASYAVKERAVARARALIEAASTS
jgi:hypothetical protein